jgi:hypothetical protein
MTMKRSILAATIFSLLSACTVESGGGDPGVDAAATGGTDAARPEPADAAGEVGDVATYCTDWGTIICSQLFTCLTAEERAAQGVPATEEECVASQTSGCPTASSADMCETGQAYQPDQAAPCIEQFGALTCEQFLDPEHDAVLAQYAPACVAICQ